MSLRGWECAAQGTPVEGSPPPPPERRCSPLPARLRRPRAARNPGKNIGVISGAMTSAGRQRPSQHAAPRPALAPGRCCRSVGAPQTNPRTIIVSLLIYRVFDSIYLFIHSNPFVSIFPLILCLFTSLVIPSITKYKHICIYLHVSIYPSGHPRQTVSEGTRV